MTIAILTLLAGGTATGYWKRILLKKLWYRAVTWLLQHPKVLKAINPHLDPVIFKGCNATRTAPADSPEVITLHCHYDGTYLISRWKLSPWARIRAALFGDVWLGVMGFTQPPMWLSTHAMDKQIIVCPACERNPKAESTAFRITAKGNNVYNCGCGAIFIKRHKQKPVIMVDPNAPAAPSKGEPPLPRPDAPVRPKGKVEPEQPWPRK